MATHQQYGHREIRLLAGKSVSWVNINTDIENMIKIVQQVLNFRQGN